MAHVTAIIPARLQSKRFTRKILHPLKGRPLIYYAWHAATRARLVDRVFVATDSDEIGRAVNSFGGAVIMTSPKPRNGTERVIEAVAGLRTDIVINLQGDNIGLPGKDIDRVIKMMTYDPRIQFATLAQPIGPRSWKDKLYSPNVVKVVTNTSGDALWFSRYPIPYLKNPDRRPAIKQYPYLEHIGVYFFRKRALKEYGSWERGKVEAVESLEQLRILENGGKIKVFLTSAEVISVDSEAAVKKAVRHI
jgi:3-deoxy-manno-octulosonate cytidylyltransferase (CMP-KDO synthetase)